MMAQKKSRWIIPLLVMAVIAAGAGGYAAGRNAAASEAASNVGSELPAGSDAGSGAASEAAANAGSETAGGTNIGSEAVSETAHGAETAIPAGSGASSETGSDDVISETVSAAAARYEAERELNILLNRSELEGLGEIKGTIYVTGHRSPDSDTVCSSIAYAALLEKLGYDAVPVVLGRINNETRYILEKAGLETPELLEDASGCNVVLVDHSEFIQSAEGLKDAHIIGIIDHHGVGTVTTGSQLIYDARPLGATSTIVWIRYRNYGVEPDPQTALIMAGAIISDTTNLHSNTTTSADREALKALSETAGISDTDAFADKLYRELISYDGMTDEEIFFSDYKEYEAGGRHFSIGCINAYDGKEAAEMAQRIKAVLPTMLLSTGMDMTFAQISIFHDDLDTTFLVPSDDGALEVLETAFGESAKFDGTSFILTPGISRKKELVPAITAVLESYPKE